jgi:hypothetical protein
MMLDEGFSSHSATPEKEESDDGQDSILTCFFNKVLLIQKNVNKRAEYTIYMNRYFFGYSDDAT